MKNIFSCQAVSVVFAVSLLLALFSCQRSGGGVNTSRSPYPKYADEVSEELEQALDALPSEDLTESDFTLENGNDLIEFIRTYDEDFLEKNPWILEFDSDPSASVDEEGIQAVTKAGGVITGNAGIVNLKNTVVSQMIIGSAFFLNSSKGIAFNRMVRTKIADAEQVGLWYKWGGKKWDDYSFPALGGMPVDGKELKCYGLDCSGFVYSAMNRIGFGIPVLRANDYYNETIWNNALQSFLLSKTRFPEKIKGNLKFVKYEYSSSEIESKVQPGDILFWGPSSGHIGIVSYSGKIAQSNGARHPQQAIDNGTARRGPHLITAKNAHTIGDVTKFGVIRLVATLDNTHWRLNIKCEGRDTYITSFDIEINMKGSSFGEIPITPVHTIGYNYDGEPCDVDFTGSFNPETQVLKGSVKKTYALDTRTDGFEVKLIDDDIYDIVEYRIISNNACVNLLDLVNLDNQTKADSFHPRVNTSSSTNHKAGCTDRGRCLY